MAWSNEFKVGLVVSVFLTVVAAGSAPWWWKYTPWDHAAAAAAPVSAVSGMSGGCAPFQAYAQNRYPPLGAAIRAQPNGLSTKIGSYSGNSIISINGWVYGTAAYPYNPPPWNSNIWFHLSDGAGWVSYAAVRAYQMTPDPDGLNPNGGPPVTTSPSCAGGVQ